MRSLSKIGLGLSVIFTCLLLALVAEIYYLLWWKRRSVTVEHVEDDNRNSRKSSYMLCCEKQATSTVNISSNAQLHQELCFHPESKPVDVRNGNILREELIVGPPRFLFTIEEETKEEMELSEDLKVTRELKRTSLNDLMKNIDISPFSSPMESCHSSDNRANFDGCSSYNPLYESSNNIEFNNISKYSPPPKFKFLRNAEEKLMRKNMLMEQVKKEGYLSKNSEGVNGSFITIIVAKNKESDLSNNHYHSPLGHYSSYPSSSSSSKVLSLAK